MKEEIISKNSVEVDPVTPVNPTREWTAIRGECVSGGQLTDECNLVAAAQGVAEIEVVLKRLSCGCILVPIDTEEDII